MNNSDMDTPLREEGLPVRAALLEAGETAGLTLLQIFYGGSAGWVVLRNPGALQGRLLRGALVNLLLHEPQDGLDHPPEVTLLLEEEDMLPEPFLLLLKEDPPAARTAFGFISDPREDRGRYYAVLKSQGDSVRIAAGEYRLGGDGGKCLAFNGQWEVKAGLVENYFFNQYWPAALERVWDPGPVNSREALDYLSLEDLDLAHRHRLAGGLLEYFHTDDWSPGFYRAQARLGFIAITDPGPASVQLLPQLQTAYAVLDWKNLSIDRRVEKILKGPRMAEEKIRLRIDPNPFTVLNFLATQWKDSTWLVPQYADLIRKLATPEERARDEGFRIWGVTLTVGDPGIPVAGELGYTIGKTYTSLSGFFIRDKKEYSNFGKLQMVLLAGALERAGIAFWNLGHPYMEYKTALGARILPRKQFLERWDEAAAGSSADLSC